MDKETKEYLDRKFLTLAQKEDVEKLRQETKSNFRQLKGEKEDLGKEWMAAVTPLHEELREGLERSKKETHQLIESFLQQVREETRAGFDQSRQERISSFQLIRDEVKAEIDRLKEGVEGVGEHERRVAEELDRLNEKIKEGFVEVKEELGAMIKFSFADLEKKLATLEARVKALEKMILP